jgi:hypothetical protein
MNQRFVDEPFNLQLSVFSQFLIEKGFDEC